MWVHVGRLYTNGDVFLAMDATLRASWRGHTDDAYDEVCHLDDDVTSIPVGRGRAALIAIDGRPNDEGWIEVFASAVTRSRSSSPLDSTTRPRLPPRWTASTRKAGAAT